MILTISNLEKTYGTNILFTKTGFNAAKNEKIAILGQNGSGKSTLFKMIAGEEDYSGNITPAKDIRISVMEQENVFEKTDLNFSDYLNSKKDKIRAQIKELESMLGDSEIYEDTRKFDKVMQEYEILCSRTTESIEETRLKYLLTSLGFSLELLNQRINSLSGGQRTALRLTEVLGTDAQLLLLDEPTNHLDFEAIRWLEEWIIKSKKTVLIASHDRAFIQNVCTKIIEIEDKHFEIYDGSYRNYVKRRSAHRIALAKKHKGVSKERKRLLDSAEEKRKWAVKNANKKLKIIADRLQRDAKNLPVITDPKDLEDKYELFFKNGSRTSNVVFEAKEITKRYDNKIIMKAMSFSIYRKDRIALIGANGSGKSTFIKILAQKINVDEGELKVGNNVMIKYFDQEHETMPANLQVIKYIRNHQPQIDDYKITRIALKFGFKHDITKKKIKELSGGEKSRLDLLRIMLSDSNVLLLDEPTNHLDIELREALESAIREYEGTVILVSHDRYFIDEVATKVFVIKEGDIEEYEGNYSSVFN